jgi:hypothetical protein
MSSFFYCQYMRKVLLSCDEYMVKPNVIINDASVTQVTVFWGAGGYVILNTGITREIHVILLYIRSSQIYFLWKQKNFDVNFC